MPAIRTWLPTYEVLPSAGFVVLETTVIPESIVTYTLSRLAPGSYDLLLDGALIGSVVQDATPSGDGRGWRAELLDDDPDAARPAPFVSAEHGFATLGDLRQWLGGAAFVQGTCNE